MFRTTFLLYFILIALTSAQWAPTSIYDHIDGPAISTAAVGGPAACRASLFVLRNVTGQQCVATMNSTGSSMGNGVLNEVCPASLQGASMLSCLGNSCYALNPVQKVIIAVSNSSITYSFSISGITTPLLFSAYLRSATVAELYVVDGADNGVWQYILSYPTPTSVSASKLPALTLPGTAAGIFMFSSTVLMFAVKGGTSLLAYTFATQDTSPWALPDPFGSIQFATTDTYGNVQVYDSSCSCIRIITSTTGATKFTVPITGTPRAISNNRNKIYVIDETGIVKYENPMSITSSWTPAKCFGVGGTISAFVGEGGDYPITVYVQPDNVFETAVYSGTITHPIVSAPVPTWPVVLLDDVQNRQIYLMGSLPNTSRAWVDNSQFPAQSGNWSYRMTFSTNEQLIMQCTTLVCINPVFFEYYEFWLNFGDGGQSLQIGITTGGTMSIAPYQYASNTWHRFRFHCPTVAAIRGVKQPGFGGMYITDLLKQPGQNPIYIDGIRLIPYEVPLPSRYLYAFDACYNYYQEVIPFVNETLMVEVVSTPVSCSANSTVSKNLSRDGILTAQLTNGQGPFNFNWSYSDKNESSISGYPEMQSYITVYDNALNKSWVDISIADDYSLNATKYVRSPPYSIAFTPTDEGQGLIFQVSPEVVMADYRAIEFWVNGGDVGGQTMLMYMIRSTQSTNIFGQSFILSSSGYTEIPAGEWIKIWFQIPLGGTVHKFNLIEFISYTPPSPPNSPIMPIPQPTLYIDDIVLVGKDVLTVTDNNGCVASTNRARIKSPPLLTQNVVINNARCFNSSDGSVTVNMGGGTPPYTFAWSTAFEDQDPIVTGLPESFVSVNASDSNMCQYEQYTATILQPPPIAINYTITPPVCYGTKGQVSAIAVGGSGSYTYSWSGSTGSPRVIPAPAPDAIFLDNVAPGFTLEKSAQICRGTGSHVAAEYYPSHSGYCSLQLQFDEHTSAAGISGCSLCLSMQKYSGIIFWLYGGDDIGYLSIAFTKGSIRSDPVLLSGIVDLVPRAWNKVSLDLVQVNNTSPDGFVLISANPPAMGTVILDDVVVVPHVANGAGYSAYPGFTSTVEVSASVRYFLTIVDGNGCSYTSEVEVPQPEAVTVIYNASSPETNNGSDGSITVVAQGGTPPYSYWWVELNSTLQNVTGLAYGVYTLRVEDANGCTMDVSIVVNPYDGPAEIKKYNAALASGLAALVGLGLLISLFAAGMLGFFWTQFSILGSFLSSMMVVGCITSFLSALVLLPDPTDNLCLAFPWLLGIGFVLVYGCLFIKTWALYQVWRKAIHYQKASLTPGYIMRCLGLALIVEIIFLIIWTVIDPPKVHLVKVVNNSLERQCDVDNVTFWVIFLVGKGAWLIFGAVLSVLSRNIVKEYNESSSIAYAIYNNVLLGAIAIPLALLIKEVPGGRLTVEVVIISLAFTFTIVVVFFKIWHTILLPDKINLAKMESGSKRSKGGSKNSSGSSGGATRTTAKESSRVSNSATDTA